MMTDTVTTASRLAEIEHRRAEIAAARASARATVWGHYLHPLAKPAIGSCDSRRLAAFARNEGHETVGIPAYRGRNASRPCNVDRRQTACP
jgi:predicted alpha/beta hydrolase